MKDWIKNLIVLGLFVALTFALTYPIILHLGSGMRDLGDPLLNCWILSWHLHKISSLDFHHYFDANIFYPNKKTLAYSEYLFTQSLFALPVWLVSDNPILVYNFVLLFSFITSGFGMFLLARYLTKNIFAGVVAGIIYAYSPFMFAHLFQIQVLAAGGMPLAFLFLHKYFESSRTRDVFLFGLFYILQVLANGYYALYLTLFAGLFILVFGITKRKYRDWKFLLKLGVSLLVVILLAAPFYLQYIQVRKEMGFSREITAEARITSFLATAAINRVYGRLTSRFLIKEGELFPGIMAVLLALLGIYAYFRRIRKKTFASKNGKRIFIAAHRFLNVLLALWVALVFIIFSSGGFEFSIKGLGRFRAHGLKNPLLLLVIFFLLREVLKKIFLQKKKNPYVREERVIFGFYLGILVLAFLFTFGTKGPYILLYKYVPGFDGIRVSSRFHIFIMFGAALFAGFCIRDYWPRLSKIKRSLVCALLPCLIFIEYFSVPIPLQKILVKKQIPEVYQWLASKKENFVVAEIPLPHPHRAIGSLECLRVYYSIYHWKNLVNGFSGYFPPLYNELCRRWQEMPLDQNIRDLRNLGVRYIIFHEDAYRQPELKIVRKALSEVKEKIQLVGIWGEDYVFELAPEPLPTKKALSTSRSKALPRIGWKVKSNMNDQLAPLAIDGSPLSRWDSGPQQKGIYFEIDLGRIARVNGFSMKLGKSFMDFPRGYFVELSTDSVNWSKVAQEEKTDLSFQAFIKPQNFSLDVFFLAREARYIRITNIGEDPIFYWSIYEIEIFGER